MEPEHCRRRFRPEAREQMLGAPCAESARASDGELSCVLPPSGPMTSSYADMLLKHPLFHPVLYLRFDDHARLDANGALHDAASKPTTARNHGLLGDAADGVALLLPCGLQAFSCAECAGP